MQADFRAGTEAVPEDAAVKIDYLTYEGARVGVTFTPDDDRDRRLLRILATAQTRLYFCKEGHVKGMSMAPQADWGGMGVEPISTSVPSNTDGPVRGRRG